LKRVHFEDLSAPRRPCLISSQVLLQIISLWDASITISCTS
jgi:hypothetical protein